MKILITIVALAVSVLTARAHADGLTRQECKEIERDTGDSTCWIILKAKEDQERRDAEAAAKTSGNAIRNSPGAKVVNRVVTNGSSITTTTRTTKNGGTKTTITTCDDKGCTVTTR